MMLYIDSVVFSMTTTSQIKLGTNSAYLLLYFDTDSFVA